PLWALWAAAGTQALRRRIVHRHGLDARRRPVGARHAGSMTSSIPLTVRTPSDLLACVPLLLGFLPEESAVLISLPPGAGPHARADLDDETDLAELSAALLAPVRRHGVARVAVVTYGPLPRARRAAAHLRAD